MTAPVDYGTSLLEQCEAILAATEAQDAKEKRLGQIPDVIRLWDAEWGLQHYITGVIKEDSYDWIDGDTGPGRFVIDTRTHAAQWILDEQERIERGENRNVHLTVDCASGVRMGYRMKVATQEDRDDGTSVVVAEFLSDHEELKYYYIRSNPFLPAAFQMPRVFILPGPAIWLSGVCLFLQIFREHNPLITFPDDPLDLESWVTSLDQSNWGVVVKPVSFLEDMAAGTIWSVVDSRWKNYHDRMKIIWQDAEITPVLRRYLAGDPEPWPGANLRHGALVVSFEDNSGVYSGTSHGGSIFDGLVRTFTDFADDFVDSSLALWEGATIPAEYYEPGQKRTNKQLPTCVYLAGENSGIKQAAFAQIPGTAVNIETGGHSMPGVNEIISAGVQAAGDIIGNLLQVGSIGGSIDAILRPLYEDTVLAWMEVKLFGRAQKQGWSRYFEFFVDGSGKAYTIESVMVLRAGAWATRPYTTTQLVVRDGHPFQVGVHFWVGDRVGATRKHNYTGRIYIDRVSKVTRSRSRDAWQSWAVTIGDDRALQDPAQLLAERVEMIVNAVHTLGVF